MQRGQEQRFPLIEAEHIPASLGLSYPGKLSTQEAFGRILPRLADLPQCGQRIVSASPDVAVSTHLGNWVSKVGVFAPTVHPDYQEDAQRLLRWQPGPKGQHIELGISEMNFFLLLGQLGLSYELCGQQLFPIGTVYDPFVCRGLDALIYGLYNGAKFIFAGTPSGVSLSPEGGAHQSIVTASLGIELPGLDYYEPAFACELEWILLQAMRECCNRTSGRSTYLRLSTKKVDQSLIEPVLQRLGQEELRRQALARRISTVEGRDLVPDALDSEVVQIATCGAMVPEAVEAAHRLAEEGVAANVLHLTSPKKLFALLTEGRRSLRRDAYATVPPGHLQRCFLNTNEKRQSLPCKMPQRTALHFLAACMVFQLSLSVLTVLVNPAPKLISTSIQRSAWRISLVPVTWHGSLVKTTEGGVNTTYLRGRPQTRSSVLKSLPEHAQGSTISHSLPMMIWIMNNYLPNPADRTHPLASPMLAPDLAGLPPALIITAEHDPLHDDGELYGKRLQDAGVLTTISSYEGIIHDFPNLIEEPGNRALNEIASALQAAFN